MTSTELSGKEILRQAAVRLDSGDSIELLAELLWKLNLELRGTYPMPPDSPERAAVLDMVCRNEMLHIVQTQIRTEVGRGLGYPDAALMAELRNKVQWGDDSCQGALNGALAHALAVTAPTADGTEDASVFERAAERLASPDRLLFLLHLARHLSDQLRSSAGNGSNSTEVRRRFACLGDLAVRTCDKMITLASGEPSVGNDTFLTDLVAAANSGLCGGALRGVLESTLGAVSETSCVR